MKLLKRLLVILALIGILVTTNIGSFSFGAGLTLRMFYKGIYVTCMRFTMNPIFCNDVVHTAYQDLKLHRSPDYQLFQGFLWPPQKTNFSYPGKPESPKPYEPEPTPMQFIPTPSGYDALYR